MTKLKTAKRKVKHLRKAYHRQLKEMQEMVSIELVNDFLNCHFPQEGDLVSVDRCKKQLNDFRLERSKESFFEHCIQPYSDTTREEFEVEYQEKFGSVKQNFKECEAREQHCPSEFNEYFHDNLSSMLSSSENDK
jgi:hypothetical protein